MAKRAQKKTAAATPRASKANAKATVKRGAKRAAKPRVAKPSAEKTSAAKSPPRRPARQARPASPPPPPPPEDDRGLPDEDFEAAADTSYDADMDAAASSFAQGFMRDGESYMDFLARMFEDMSTGGWDANQIDDMTQGFGMVLGSGPAFAALESMLSNVSAQSAVMMNAAHTQRQLDHVGLCCTSACVKQLLSLGGEPDGD